MARPNKTLIASLAVLTGVLLLVVVVLRSNRHAEQPVTASPVNGVSAVGLPSIPAAKTTTGKPAKSTQVAAPAPKPVPPSEPVWMKFPSVGLTLAMGKMAAANGVIDPPSADIGYWISNRGVMPATNAQGSVFA